MSTPHNAGSDQPAGDSLLDQILHAMGPIEDDPPIDLDPAGPPRLECPRCRASEVLPIVYGLPGPETLDKALEGVLRLGGCCIRGKEPRWRCSVCGHQWGNLLDRDKQSWLDYRTMLAWIDKHYKPLSDEARRVKLKEVEDRIARMRAQLTKTDRRDANKNEAGA